MSLRPDFRHLKQARRMTVEFDGLSRVDGSARFGFGPHAQALASISGPIEVRLAAESASRATLEVHVRPLTAVGGTEHKALASFVAMALQPSLILTHNPRSLVQLIVQDLVATPAFKKPSRLSNPSDGTGYVKERILASMINAGSLAFLKAGSVPMRGVVCAVFVARLRDDVGDGSVCIVDPTDEEMTSVEAGGCFAFLFANGVATCVWSNWKGRAGFTADELVEAKQKARTAAEDIWHRMKASLSGRGEEEDASFESDEDAKMEI